MWKFVSRRADKARVLAAPIPQLQVPLLPSSASSGPWHVGWLPDHCEQAVTLDSESAEGSSSSAEIEAARRFAEMYHVGMVDTGEVSPTTKTEFEEKDGTTVKPKLRRSSARIDGHNRGAVVTAAAAAALAATVSAEGTTGPWDIRPQINDRFQRETAARYGEPNAAGAFAPVLPAGEAASSLSFRLNVNDPPESPSAATTSTTLTQDKYDSTRSAQHLMVPSFVSDESHKSDRQASTADPCQTRSSLFPSSLSSIITFSYTSSEYHEFPPSPSAGTDATRTAELDQATLILANALIKSLHEQLDEQRGYLRRSDNEIHQLVKTLDLSNIVLGETYRAMQALADELSETVEKLDEERVAGKQKTWEKVLSGTVSLGRRGLGSSRSVMLRALRDDENAAGQSSTAEESSKSPGLQSWCLALLDALRDVERKIHGNAEELGKNVADVVKNTQLCKRLHRR